MKRVKNISLSCSFDGATKFGESAFDLNLKNQNYSPIGGDLIQKYNIDGKLNELKILLNEMGGMIQIFVKKE